MSRCFTIYGAVALALLLIGTAAFADVPRIINYQGKITDDLGAPAPDGFYLVKFTLADDSTAGTELWNSGFRRIAVADGLFDYLLGDSTPLPPNLFVDNDEVYIGITVGADSEMLPRARLSASPWAFMAERTQRSRDLYHEIVDINPNSTTTVPFVSWTDAPSVVLYLYGSEFQAALPEHTHAGNNSHTHDFDGVVQDATVNHTHSLSPGGTTSNGASHTHSGNTGYYDLSHNHGGYTGYYNTSHSHTGFTDWDGAHHHDFLFTGVSDGIFLVHASNYNGLDAHGEVQLKTATGSVSMQPSDHHHRFTTNDGGSNHRHTISNFSGNHRHSFTTGTASSNHSHDLTGNTGSAGITHNHAFTGIVEYFGLGLENTGIPSTDLPGSVSVYVDDVLAAGPFVGEFASGAIDLSSFVTGSGEHEIEIVESGGSGGRITYNLFVE